MKRFKVKKLFKEIQLPGNTGKSHRPYHFYKTVER